MPETIADLFLRFSHDRLLLLGSRVADCVGRLSNEQLWTRMGANQNAIGNLVLHLCGNVQQWIVSGVGGEADVRDRAAEFAQFGGATAGELQVWLDATLTKAGAVIRALPASRLTETITVQHQEKAVLEVIYTVVEHFAQHTGQVIFATKALTGEDLGYYSSLSPPRDRV
jgi:uncharacterized damage-inducible protein DinB